MIDFTLQDLDSGWLRMKIQFDRKYIMWSCDECLSDPLPGMVNMYNALKEGRNAVWSIERGQRLTFRTTFKDDDKSHVWLEIHAEQEGGVVVEDERHPNSYYGLGPDGEEEAHFEDDIDAEEEFATEILMEKFETFFRLLLSSRFYPCQFPCWLYGEDDDLWDKAVDAVDAAHPGLGYKEENLLTRLYESEHQTLNAEGKEFFKKFDTMLKTHKVPEEWQ